MDQPSSGLPAAAAVDTDAPTETYIGIAADPPPAAPPPDGAAPGPPRRRPSRRAAALSALGVVFVAGLAAWGATSSGDLTTHRSSLATSQTELAAAHTSLDSTRASLDSTKASVATVSTDREAQEKEVADLSAQVAAETSCISLQQKALDEVDRISGLQTTNFNRTATKSVWSTAETARGKAIDAALDAYYKAYSNAFEGRTSAARTWVANGKAAEARMTAQLKIASAELKTVDTAAAEIEKAMDDLADLLGETERACAAVTE